MPRKTTFDPGVPTTAEAPPADDAPAAVVRLTEGESALQKANDDARAVKAKRADNLRERAAALAWDPDALRAFLVDLIDHL